MLNTRQIYPMSDFLRNHKTHVARLKESRTPEVLTVNGRAEVVLLDTESYESMVEQLNYQQRKEDEEQEKAIAAARIHMAKSLKNAPPQEPVSEAEMEMRYKILEEMVADNQRLGLY